MSRPIRFCTIEGCEERRFGRGLCGKHYARLLRGKDPLMATRKDPNVYIIKGSVSEIILRNKNQKEIARAIVDTDDLPLLREYIWSYGTVGGYAYSHTKGPTVMMHKLINKTPKGFLTDHIDGNRLDNRKSNLRTVNTKQNTWNTSASKRKKHSRYKGVCILKPKDFPLKRPWMAYIGKNGKREHLGYFASEIEAAVAYDNAAVDKFGEYARLNFYLDPKTINLNQITWE